MHAVLETLFQDFQRILWERGTQIIVTFNRIHMLFISTSALKITASAVFSFIYNSRVG